MYVVNLLDCLLEFLTVPLSHEVMCDTPVLTAAKVMSPGDNVKLFGINKLTEGITTRVGLSHTRRYYIYIRQRPHVFLKVNLPMLWLVTYNMSHPF